MITRAYYISACDAAGMTVWSAITEHGLHDQAGFWAPLCVMIVADRTRRKAYVGHDSMIEVALDYLYEHRAQLPAPMQAQLERCRDQSTEFWTFS